MHVNNLEYIIATLVSAHLHSLASHMPITQTIVMV